MTSDENCDDDIDDNDYTYDDKQYLYEDNDDNDNNSDGNCLYQWWCNDDIDDNGKHDNGDAACENYVD